MPFDRRIAAVAKPQHGVIARGQLLGMGLSPGDLRGRITRGSLIPLHRGVYAVGHLALTREARWMAAVLACGPGAVLSHRSAARLWGILPGSGSAIDVTRPRTSRKRPGIRTYRAIVPDDEVEVLLGIPLTAVFRTILDLAGGSAPREVEKALNEAEFRGLPGLRSLAELLARYPSRPGSPLVRSLLAKMKPLGVTRSKLEELFLVLLDRHEIPRPRLNFQIAAGGRFFEADCVWPERRLIVELDGRAAHLKAQAFDRDRERDRILLADGWRTIRVTWGQLHEQPESVLSDLRRML
jgi:very-short-patch-repair endonuclease